MKSLGFETSSKYAPKSSVDLDQIKNTSRADKIKFLEAQNGPA